MVLTYRSLWLGTSAASCPRMKSHGSHSGPRHPLLIPSQRAWGAGLLPHLPQYVKQRGLQCSAGLQGSMGLQHSMGKWRRKTWRHSATPTSWVDRAPVNQQEPATAADQAPQPVLCCSTVTLEGQATFQAAVSALLEAVMGTAKQLAGFESGVVRYEVPIPRSLATSLEWLQGQISQPQLLPRVYFSPRRSPAPNTPGTWAAEQQLEGGAMAGVGAAWLWQGPPGTTLREHVVASMTRFLSSSQPRIRVLGATRFDPSIPPDPEWMDFGSYLFFLPSIELSDVAECSLLACQLAWDGSERGPMGAAAKREGGTEGRGVGARSLGEAVAGVVGALQMLQAPAAPAAPSLCIERHSSEHTPSHNQWHVLMSNLLDSLVDDTSGFHAPTTLDSALAMEEYFTNGQQGLDALLAAVSENTLDGKLGSDGCPDLSKLVLARRTKIKLSGRLEPLQLVQALQERDPRAYQLYLQAPGGAIFFGSTPERLFVRSGRWLASEAVAGTRPRGPPGQMEADFWLGLELLSSHKDHMEFTQVREWIKRQLQPLCKQLTVEVAKSVIKQATLQHLYGRLSGELREDVNDAHLLAALHPTPAVCGRPRGQAEQLLREVEAFDRGLYAGPFGWMSGGGAEFAVAIRSALVLQSVGHSHGYEQLLSSWQVRPSPVPQPQVHLYAGVGVVQGSDAQSEWNELDLKIRMLDRLLTPVPSLSCQPNVNLAWAALAVEELCRLGASMFCIAPGSRSSPLACAISRHPRARITVCVDERSLAFWALGYSRATGRPAVVVTSSGTAVANLLPAVVEASCSHVPLLLVTADRPVELRDTSANQTIDQVKIFGSYTRWSQDISPPHPSVPGRSLLTTISTAVLSATATPAGPVHLNFQFREPLAPNPVAFDSKSMLHGLEHWSQSQLPFTKIVSGTGGMLLEAGAWSAGCGMGADDGQVHQVLRMLCPSVRGLLVVGELMCDADVMHATRIARCLGWPVVVDVLSGMRVGNTQAGLEGVSCISHMDHILLGGEPDWWGRLKPDVMLQLGPHVTSKRLAQFMEWCSTAAPSSLPTPWVYAAPHALRQDPAHLVSHRLVMPLSQLAALLEASLSPAAGTHGREPGEAMQPLTPATMSAVLYREDGETDSRGSLQAEQGEVYSLGNAGRGGTAKVHGRNGATAGQEWAHSGSANCAAKGSNGAEGGYRQDEVLTGRLGRGLSRESAGEGREGQLGAALEYARMLMVLDRAVGHEIDKCLEALPNLNEPFVARQLSRLLLPSNGLFLGNSMPIRDMDMYATTSNCSPCNGHGAAGPHHSTPLPVGVAVAANRGASGIDGVLSTAAGFADGLGRPVTLVIGDLSFLHDTNGLTLLRAAPSRQPLTVILINNSGGGIFSFLPIADSLHSDEFTPLWATPQNVDLEGLCRAHGIPHQKLTHPEELSEALQRAWGLNAHSVVELITDRASNVELHREIQVAARAAARAAWELMVVGGPHTGTPAASSAQLSSDSGASCNASVATSMNSNVCSAADCSVATAGDSNLINAICSGSNVSVDSSSNATIPSPVQVVNTSNNTNTRLTLSALEVVPFELPLAQALTTTTPTRTTRQGLLVRVQLQVSKLLGNGNHGMPITDGSSTVSGWNGTQSGKGTGIPSANGHGIQSANGNGTQSAGRETSRRVVVGVGEVSPLPGLHRESVEEARAQLGLVEALLEGTELDRSVALLGGRMGKWLSERIGFPAEDLLPSVRCGLEFSLLGALASSQGLTLDQLLRQVSFRPVHPGAPKADALHETQHQHVLLNALVDARDTETAVGQAQAAVQAGFGALKVKVGRRSQPLEDARLLCALRQALPADIVLRADANRSWTLDQAMHFARAVGPAQLQYIEEACKDPSDLISLFRDAGVPVALDESIDEGLLSSLLANRARISASGDPGGGYPAGGRNSAGPNGINQDVSELCARLEELRACGGLAAVVVKPMVVGGLEATVELAKLAWQSNVRVVISSSFESGVGVGLLTQLAGAADVCAGEMGGENHHGLGTLGWFDFRDGACAQGVCGSTLHVQHNADGTNATNDLGTSSPGHESRLGTRNGNGGTCMDVASSTNGVASMSGASSTNGTSTSGVGSPSAAHGMLSHLQGLTLSMLARMQHGSVPVRAYHDLLSSQSMLFPSSMLFSPSQNNAALVETKVTREQHAALTGAPYSHSSLQSHCIDELHSIEDSAQLPHSLPSHPEETTATGERERLHEAATAAGAQGMSPSILSSSMVSGRTISRSVTIPASSSTFQFHCQHRPADPTQITYIHPKKQQIGKVLFLHGFLGDSAEWLPLMSALSSVGYDCVAVDLPGHGQTRVMPAQQDLAAGQKAEDEDGGKYSVESVAAALGEVIQQEGLQGCMLVGYSLGARVSLAVAAQYPSLLSRLLLISGSPGIPSAAQRQQRAHHDEALAAGLRSHGVQVFGEQWYQQPMWSSLRAHPRGLTTIGARLERAQAGPGAARLAQGLEQMSTGRMVPLWSSLATLRVPTCLLVGELDRKFVQINHRMLQYMTQAPANTTGSGMPGSSQDSALSVRERDKRKNGATIAPRISSTSILTQASRGVGKGKLSTITLPLGGTPKTAAPINGGKPSASTANVNSRTQVPTPSVGGEARVLQHRMHVIPWCGHAVHVERTDCVLRHLTEFARELGK